MVLAKVHFPPKIWPNRIMTRAETNLPRDGWCLFVGAVSPKLVAMACIDDILMVPPTKSSPGSTGLLAEARMRVFWLVEKHYLVRAHVQGRTLLCSDGVDW